MSRTKQILLFLPFLIISCRSGDKTFNTETLLCVHQVYYDNRESSFSPGLIKIQIVDQNSKIMKMGDSIQQIIFENVDEQDRQYFVRTDHTENQGDTVIIGVLTNYFKLDTLKRWTTKDVNKFLGGNIRLIANNDTLKLQQCR